MRIIILTILCIYIATCQEEEDVEINPSPHFRRIVEEITDDAPIKKVTKDSDDDLLTLLVRNVKELFNENDKVKGDAQYHEESTLKHVEIEHVKPTTTLEVNTLIPDVAEVVASTIETEPAVNVLNAPEPVVDKIGIVEDLTTMGYLFRRYDLKNVENNNDVVLYKYLPLIQTANNLDEPTATEALRIVETTKVGKTRIGYSEVMKTTEELEFIEKSEPSSTRGDKPTVTPPTSLTSYVLETSDLIIRKDANKSCIYCNNVLNDNCRDPKNKIVPSIVCNHVSDSCYSLHTPFGLVERGCFNLKYNLTTYVCSCNLCNYISIWEMPYFFSDEKDWIENVFELSRTKSLRRSIFKDMACLRCEVNKTAKMDENMHCLEGNVEHLPVEECNENEICAVRAQRAGGYIWRGCIKRPLYNYWISLCNDNLCNFDKLLSIYHP